MIPCILTNCLPFVFMMSTYLIRILGSKLILSNNQSRATLVGVLDACLIVGLRLFLFFLITASLSSKMYNWDSPWEECVFVGTPFFLLIVPRRTLFLVPSLAFVTVFRVATTVRTKTKTQAWARRQIQPLRDCEIPNGTPFRVATFTRKTPPFHKMPKTTPNGLLPTGTINRKKGVHNPHGSIAQPFAFFLLFRSWFWNGVSHQFLGC